MKKMEGGLPEPFPLFRRAETGDAAFVAEGLNMASHGLMRRFLGPGYGEVLARVIRVPGHDLSLGHVWIADTAEGAAGMLSGMDGSVMADFSGVLCEAAGPLIWRAGFFALLALPMLRAMAVHHAGDWYVQALAVSPSMRGMGLGRQFMALAEEEARRCGCGRVTLDVAVSNAPALRLYERLGYVREWTSPKTWFPWGARVHRLSRKL